MNDFIDTNADNTLEILEEGLGTIFDTLSKETIARLVKAFGEEFEEFASGSQDWNTF